MANSDRNLLFPSFQPYFKDPWNTFDFITVVGSIVDALMVEFAVSLLARNCLSGDRNIDTLPFSTEKLHQCRIPQIVSGCPSDQAASSGLHHQNTSLDIRAEFQGPTLRYSPDRHAFLYLRHNRNAGKLVKAMILILDLLVYQQ